MKSTFTAKYLQHLNKKNGNKGFTLIELLVVIIIVGVLAAIALPSFLNQVGKSRGSEAKTNIGTINRAQQSFRLEQNTMATALTDLDAQITGKFYTYAIVANDNNNSGTTASLAITSITDLKTYSSVVQQIPAAAGTPERFVSVICESNINAGAFPTAGLPTTAAPRGTCGGGKIAD
jgi:type IV pilus assembly protein PilA